MPDVLTRRKTCRLCDGKDLELVLSLTPTPPANALVSKEQLTVKQECFPLDVFQCCDCGHVQLLDVLDPHFLFEHYLYVSATSPVFVKHLQDYADWVISTFNMPPKSLVVEAGSNDGTFLKFFKQAEMEILGIDPARNLAEAATKSGIETLAEMFTILLARKIRRERGPAKVIVANNVFAHADDLAGFADAARELLDNDGVFILEVSYLVDVYEKTLFDTIYHEHLSYHTVAPLARFFEAHGMELIAVQRVQSQGGSLRAVVQKKNGNRKVNKSVSELIQLEQSLGLDTPDTMKFFASQIDALRRDLNQAIREIKGKGKRIAAFGAPAKATTLMYYFGLGPDKLDFIVDDNPLKQGLFTPGLHIPILPTQTLYEKRPDYLLILAWNFAEDLMRRHEQYHSAGGRFIVPIPKVEII